MITYYLLAIVLLLVSASDAITNKNETTTETLLFIEYSKVYLNADIAAPQKIGDASAFRVGSGIIKGNFTYAVGIGLWSVEDLIRIRTRSSRVEGYSYYEATNIPAVELLFRLTYRKTIPIINVVSETSVGVNAVNAWRNCNDCDQSEVYIDGGMSLGFRAFIRRRVFLQFDIFDLHNDDSYISHTMSLGWQFDTSQF